MTAQTIGTGIATLVVEATAAEFPAALVFNLAVVRFRMDGSGWTYCDTDGAGSNAGSDWSFDLAHPLTVE